MWVLYVRFWKWPPSSVCSVFWQFKIDISIQHGGAIMRTLQFCLETKCQCHEWRSYLFSISKWRPSTILKSDHCVHDIADTNQLQPFWNFYTSKAWRPITKKSWVWTPPTCLFGVLPSKMWSTIDCTFQPPHTPIFFFFYWIAVRISLINGHDAYSWRLCRDVVSNYKLESKL